jgi:hypothetical protein
MRGVYAHVQVSREAWSARSLLPDLDQERAMTTPDVPVTVSPPTSVARRPGTLREHATMSWWWLWGALLLALGAQVIIISALVSVDPLAVTWWSLLLAIAPAPVAGAAAFGPEQVKRLAAAVGLLVMIAGVAGGILHQGLFFLPALVALAVGAVKL